MKAAIYRQLGVFLISAMAGLAVWHYEPGTTLDRGIFQVIARLLEDSPVLVVGKGTHAEPWQVQAYETSVKADAKQAPMVVSLGDDPERFFQSSPPAPIDLAVIFTNFQRLGVKHAASAAVLAWEAPDPIGYAALDKALGRFESVTLAAPLSRGPVSTPIPAAFRRASLPITQVQGNTASLPVVNRIPIPEIMLGGENVKAGFSVLESELGSSRLPLIARWEDRVVMSFPLLIFLQRVNRAVDTLEIRLGETLQIGPGGPIFPINEYGQLVQTVMATDAMAVIAAPALIEGTGDLFPAGSLAPVILRDDRSSIEPRNQAFSKSLAGAVTILASNRASEASRIFPRLSQQWELGILAFVVSVMTVLSGGSLLMRSAGALLLIGVCHSAQWIVLGDAPLWLPVIPALAAIFAAIAAERILPDTPPSQNDYATD